MSVKVYSFFPMNNVAKETSGWFWMKRERKYN